MRVLLRLLLVVLMAMALVRVGCFAVYASNQVVVPTEAYHLESKSIHLAWRVLEGRTLYPDWTERPVHVSNFFGPLYFLVVGGIGRLSGADLDGLIGIGRLVTIGCGVLAAMAVGVASGRREGSFAGVFAGLLAIGSAPMIGFGTMVRPDLMADLLGFLGFLVAAGGGASRVGRRRLVIGGALLVAAIFTKQTTGLYLLSAVLALAITGSRSKALGLAVGSAVVSGLIVLGVTLTVEPRFAVDLLGESGSPSSIENWRYVLWRLWTLSRELILLPVLGIGLWTVRGRREWPVVASGAVLLIGCSIGVLLRAEDPHPMALVMAAIVPIGSAGVWAAIDPSRPRDLPLATLSAVLLLGSTAAAIKLGSDLNYFLGVRLVAAMAGGAAWGAVQRFASARPGGANRGVIRGLATMAALLLLGYGLVPGIVHDYEQMRMIRGLNQYAFSGPGRAVLQLRRELFDLAGDPDATILSDSGEIQLRRRDRAEFVDPWLFRVMVMHDRIDPAGLRRDLEQARFEVIVTTKDLFDAQEPYDSYDFGLPPELAELARRNYRMVGQSGGLFLYEPKAGAR